MSHLPPTSVARLVDPQPELAHRAPRRLRAAGPPTDSRSPRAASPQARPLARVLRVLSYNVHGLYVASRHRARRMRAIGALMRELGPDLVSIQEAFVESDRRALAEALRGSDLAHSAYFPSGVVGSGLLVFGKAPILARSFRPFEHRGPWWKPWQGDWYAGKGVALARFELPCGPVDLFDTHAIASYGPGGAANHAERCAQMVELADFVREHSRPAIPAIVAGDLNATCDEAPYRIATRVGALERVAADEGGLDHVLAARCERLAIEPVETRLLREHATLGARRIPLSDHPAVLATLRVTARSDALATAG